MGTSESHKAGHDLFARAVLMSAPGHAYDTQAFRTTRASEVPFFGVTAVGRPRRETVLIPLIPVVIHASQTHPLPEHTKTKHIYEHVLGPA